MIVVCAIDRPRSAIISTRSRRLSLNRRYQRTHRMMTSRSKWRPSNSSSMLFSLPIADPQPVQPPPYPIASRLLHQSPREDLGHGEGDRHERPPSADEGQDDPDQLPQG